MDNSFLMQLLSGGSGGAPIRTSADSYGGNPDYTLMQDLLHNLSATDVTPEQALYNQIKGVLAENERQSFGRGGMPDSLKTGSNSIFPKHKETQQSNQGGVYGRMSSNDATQSIQQGMGGQMGTNGMNFPLQGGINFSTGKPGDFSSDTDQNDNLTSFLTTLGRLGNMGLMS